MLQDKSILAIVPARSGSKGIPNKNLCKIGGISLIGWTARLIQQLPWIDRAMLSTDSEKLAQEGRRFGLTVPTLRPAELASDTAQGVDVWRHAWLLAETYWNQRFDIAIYLQPTTPLRRPEHITKTVDTLINSNFEVATTIAPVPGHFIPEKILRLGKDGRIYPYSETRLSNRQEAPRYYYRTGACYAALRNAIIIKRQIIESICAGVVIDEFTANIDEPIDLKFAEFLHQQNTTKNPKN